MSRDEMSWPSDNRMGSSATGPVVLKPTTSPFLRFLFTVGAAIFWNGIVSVFIFAGIHEKNGGFFGWVFFLFLIPFELVGIVLIGSIVYTFLAMFNPRPTLKVNDTAIQLGFPLEVSW